MKNLYRIISLVLSTLAIVSAFSCSNADTTNETTVIEENETSKVEIPLDEINRENAVLGLPELDFGETVINILYSGERVYAQDIVAEQNGEVVDEAVYARNLAIEELLNVKFNPITYSESTQTTSDHLAQTVLAGDDIYDLCSVHQAYTIKYISEGYFINFADDEYIDFDMPWWDTEYMEEMVVGNDRIFFLIGDISLMRMKSLGCIYYNKDMYEDLFGDRDELYDIVFDGKWTFETFDQYTRDAYADLNGNSIVDDGDRFGAFGSYYKSVEHYFYDAGITSTTKNADGIPELTMNNERTVNFVELIYKYYYENPGMKITTDDTFMDVITGFTSGNFLFAPIWLRYAENFREMTTDYGIICMPKYLETDEYRTLVHDGTTVYVTPVTSQKADMIGAVCEAMGYYNYISVIPAYYEVALKVKYSRDDKTSQMLDLISDSAYTNFGYVYALLMNQVTNFRGIIGSKTSDFSSWYAKNEATALTGLQSIIDLYQGK